MRDKNKIFFAAMLWNSIFNANASDNDQLYYQQQELQQKEFQQQQQNSQNQLRLQIQQRRQAEQRLQHLREEFPYSDITSEKEKIQKLEKEYPSKQ